MDCDGLWKMWCLAQSLGWMHSLVCTLLVSHNWVLPELPWALRNCLTPSCIPSHGAHDQWLADMLMWAYKAWSPYLNGEVRRTIKDLEFLVESSEVSVNTEGWLSLSLCPILILLWVFPWDHSPINFLHAPLHVRVCFRGAESMTDVHYIQIVY